MIPEDYRLEQVAAGLVERLDGARASFDDAEQARAAFARMTEEHLAAVVAEWRALGWNEDPERHAAFLRREIVDTFLPRFTREAVRITASEASGHGLGGLATPVGRLGLVGVTLGAIFLFGRFVYLPWIWPLLLAALALPFLPDVLAWLSQRAYRSALERAVSDMARIQDQALAYDAVGGGDGVAVASSGPARPVAEPAEETPRRPPPVRESS